MRDDRIAVCDLRGLRFSRKRSISWREGGREGVSGVWRGGLGRYGALFGWNRSCSAGKEKGGGGRGRGGLLWSGEVNSDVVMKIEDDGMAYGPVVAERGKYWVNVLLGCREGEGRGGGAL